MAVMRLDFPLSVVDPARVGKVLGDEAVWAQANEAGMRDSSVMIDPDDHSKVTVLTRWSSAEQMREQGEKVTSRVVAALNENGLKVEGEPQVQKLVSPHRLT